MTRFTLGFTICLSFVATLVNAHEVRATDVIAVCPTTFRPSLERWIQHRQTQGIEVTVVESAADVTALKRLIHQASDDQTRYVILIGDAPVIGTRCDPTNRAPTCYFRTTVSAKWGTTPTLATDLPFGDLNNDGTPDAAVGRLPVQRNSELEQLIDRIIAYEQSDDFGPWRAEVQLIGGVGGFGAMVDTAIESVTRTVVTGVLPTETKTSVTYASPGHKFFPKDESFTDAVITRYQRGARFWVYAGHGQVTELDRVPQTADGIPVLDQTSLLRLKRPSNAAPIALLLACYTGAVDASEDSFCERMLLCPGGPIAVVAGSRVTMPYGNTTAAVGLINGVYQQRHARLGDAWLATLKQMHAQDEVEEKSTSRIMIDALATLVSPAGTQLIDERHEHMKLYNLLGDPMLQLHPPHSATVRVQSGFDVGEVITVGVKSPVMGELTVSLDRPLGSVTGDDPNDTLIAKLTQPIEPNEFVEPQFKIPAHVTGPIVVRAIVSGSKSWATGAAKTIIRSPPKTPTVGNRNLQ